MRFQACVIILFVACSATTTVLAAPRGGQRQGFAGGGGAGGQAASDQGLAVQGVAGLGGGQAALGRRMPNPLLVVFDVNRDGAITSDEIQAVVQMLYQLDANGDGQITGDELPGPGGPAATNGNAAAPAAPAGRGNAKATAMPGVGARGARAGGR